MRVFYLFLCILSQLGTGNFLPIATTWYEKKKKNNVWKCACIVATTNTARRDIERCLALKHGPIVAKVVASAQLCILYVIISHRCSDLLMTEMEPSHRSQIVPDIQYMSVIFRFQIPNYSSYFFPAPDYRVPVYS